MPAQLLHPVAGRACVAVFERVFGKLTATDIAELAVHADFLDALEDYGISLIELPATIDQSGEYAPSSREIIRETHGQIIRETTPLTVPLTHRPRHPVRRPAVAPEPLARQGTAPIPPASLQRIVCGPEQVPLSDQALDAIRPVSARAAPFRRAATASLPLPHQTPPRSMQPCASHPPANIAPERRVSPERSRVAPRPVSAATGKTASFSGPAAGHPAFWSASRRASRASPTRDSDSSHSRTSSRRHPIDCAPSLSGRGNVPSR